MYSNLQIPINGQKKVSRRIAHDYVRMQTIENQWIQFI